MRLTFRDGKSMLISDCLLLASSRLECGLVAVNKLGSLGIALDPREYIRQYTHVIQPSGLPISHGLKLWVEVILIIVAEHGEDIAK